MTYSDFTSGLLAPQSSLKTSSLHGVDKISYTKTVMIQSEKKTRKIQTTQGVHKLSGSLLLWCFSVFCVLCGWVWMLSVDSVLMANVVCFSTFEQQHLRQHVPSSYQCTASPSNCWGQCVLTVRRWPLLAALCESLDCCWIIKQLHALNMMRFYVFCWGWTVCCADPHFSCMRSFAGAVLLRASLQSLCENILYQRRC